MKRLKTAILHFLLPAVALALPLCSVQADDVIYAKNCAQVINGADGLTYQITGTVDYIYNPMYGNWYLKDDTGEIVIYGTRNRDGETGRTYPLDDWGISVGDIVTVRGPKTTYYGIAELVDVTVISVQKPIVQDSVTVSPAGHATFYSSDNAYSLPSGLVAKVVKSAEDNMLTCETIADGSSTTNNILPRGTAVILSSKEKKAKTYKLTVVDNQEYYDGENLLHGSDYYTYTSGWGYHYKLTYGPSNTSWNKTFGWFWGAENGNSFYIEGHRAWLVLPWTYKSRIQGFSVEGDVLGIGQNSLEPTTSHRYYDLQGRRIATPSKPGMYIHDGKKVVK